VQVHTTASDISNETNVLIQLLGSKTKSPRLQLGYNSGNLFNTDAVNNFLLQTVDIGLPVKIVLTKSGRNFNWLLYKVSPKNFLENYENFFLTQNILILGDPAEPPESGQVLVHLRQDDVEKR